MRMDNPVKPTMSSTVEGLRILPQQRTIGWKIRWKLGLCRGPYGLMLRSCMILSSLYFFGMMEVECSLLVSTVFLAICGVLHGFTSH